MEPAKTPLDMASRRMFSISSWSEVLSSAAICSKVTVWVSAEYPGTLGQREDGQQAQLVQLLGVQLAELGLVLRVVSTAAEAEEVDQLAQRLALGRGKVLLTGDYLLHLLPLGEL